MNSTICYQAEENNCFGNILGSLRFSTKPGLSWYHTDMNSARLHLARGPTKFRLLAKLC